MSIMEDLISFDLIETQKENIQSLPQGRSARALVAQFGPTPFSPLPTPGATRSLNDAIRQEYETELQGIAESDDPLDIYDRYVKWTMNAYPSAQATPESQLRTLLERATKTFQGSAQYKNDVRYLKMWLSYIRFFSDAPRETYAYLSRHGIGDGLALFYEEFAAWLEGAGRWHQAEEVYRLGIDKEARPAERLMRKLNEFEKRFQSRPQDADEPTSPALPTVRPALAAKLDPFASAAPSDPQSRRGLNSAAPGKSGRAKMTIFSDSGDTDPSSRPSSASGDRSKGWDNIGTVAERRKENVVEARPWVGETLKAGKKSTGLKMMVFRDQPANESRSVVITTKNGKTEKWFADILSVCPNEKDSKDEYCFEEMRARHRGWLDRTWAREKPKPKPRHAIRPSSVSRSSAEHTSDLLSDSTQNISLEDDTKNFGSENATRSPRLKKKKTKEVRGETQTVKAVLDSPVKKTKLKRKKSSEATMTLHTKAATDDVLDLFNQPLRNIGPIGSHESDGDTTDYDPDDYTCGVSSVGDNTRTGNLSDTGSVYNDDENSYQSESGPTQSTQPDSISPWSDFSTKRHVPPIDTQQTANGDDRHDNPTQSDYDSTKTEELKTPLDNEVGEEDYHRFKTETPQQVKIPTRPFRSAAEAAQSRLPFMTPIVEMTESSMGLPTIRQDRDARDAKTPSRRRGDVTETIHELDSPLESLSLDAYPAKDNNATSMGIMTGFEIPLIHDSQLNPHDNPVRDAIMAAARISKFAGYWDHRDVEFKKGPELRRYIKSSKSTARASTDKAGHLQPSIRFPRQKHAYTIRRELGKGAYAPVYLAATTSSDDTDDSESFVAVKSENPPSAWEFYILSALHARLSTISPSATSLVTRPIEFHHFSDEVYLVESYHDQGTLLDLVNLSRSEPTLLGTADAKSNPLGLDECVAMFFAVSLLRSIEAMHGVGIIHGDIKADNCLVRLEPLDQAAWSARYDARGLDGWADKGLTLIDLGRGIDMTAFRRDVGFLADWKTTRDDCVEMRELRPWTHQVDYWGAAGVLHIMLFGKGIEDAVDTTTREAFSPTPSAAAASSEAETAAAHGGDGADRTIAIGKAGMQRRKLREGLKRYWQTRLWADVFDLLMNPTSWLDGDSSEDRLPATSRLNEVTSALEAWLEENSEKRGLRIQLKKLEDRIRDRRRKE